MIRILFPRLVVIGLGVVLMHGSGAARDLSVCIDKKSPASAADHAIVKEIAAIEHARLNVVNFDSGGDEDAFGFKDFHDLLTHKCSFVLGFPVETANASLPKDLAVTPPYGKTGYVLAVAKDLDAPSLAALPAGTEVAVTSGGIANFILADYSELKPNLLPTERDTLQALTSGEDKAALLWRPIIDRSTAARFDLHRVANAHATWNLTALYAVNNVREAADFTRALEDLRTSGDLARTTARYGIDQNADATEEHVAPPATSAALPPALYTLAQAKIGDAKFEENCSQCHGADLTGISGPALVGPMFASVKADFTVGNIFLIVSQNMPATQPGSLAHDDYVEIMSFLLKKNGYPAGNAALTYDGATKSAVSFIYRGK